VQTRFVTQEFRTYEKIPKPVTGKEFFNYYLDPHPEHAPEALMD